MKPRQGVPIRFLECNICHRNFEFTQDFYELSDDEACVWCVNGEEIPHEFRHLEYITLEDLDGEVIPRRLQECFSKIDEPTTEEQMIHEAKPEAKKMKHKRKKMPETK